MKRSLALVLALTSGIALSAAAQSLPAPAAAPAAAAPAGPAKVAVIEFQAAVSSTNEFQREIGDLQKKFEPREVALKAQNDELESLTKQLQAQSASLSDAARATQTRSIDEKKKKFDRDVEDYRNDTGQAMNDAYSKVAAKVFDVLAAYVQQQGYTVVLDASETQQQAPVVLYHAESSDISKAVVEAYNVKSGVPAPPPQPVSAPAPKPAAAKPPAAH